MITRDDKLQILENFQVDRSLPKYARRQKSTGAQIHQAIRESKTVGEGFEDDMSEDMYMSGSSFNVLTPAGAVVMGPMGAVGAVGPAGPRMVPWTRRFGAAFWAFWAWLGGEEEQPEGVSIAEFFLSVKNSAQELEVVAKRAIGYTVAMENARRSGQRALLERLKDGLDICRNETQLAAAGSRRFLSEEDLVRFVKAAKKGLRLDWIGNFARPVPAEVVAAKARLDEVGAFDNYAVLHYDPGARSWAETRAEAAARRDPVLFGLMRGSRRLYFVGDWVDEQCDLTLDQIADALGEGAVQEIGDGPEDMAP